MLYLLFLAVFFFNNLAVGLFLAVDLETVLLAVDFEVVFLGFLAAAFFTPFLAGFPFPPPVFSDLTDSFR